MVTCKVPFLLVLYRTSHVLDPGGGGDVRRGVLRAAVKRQCRPSPDPPLPPARHSRAFVRVFTAMSLFASVVARGIHTQLAC